MYRKHLLPTMLRGLLALVVGGVAGLACSAVTAHVFPGARWERVASPADAGFDARKLSAVHATVQALDPTAMMVVVGGRVLFEYGDTAHVSYVASVRKSVLAMLYGKYVADGTIRLEATLAELGFDDIGGLSEREKQATVGQLLTARSGIYHPAANGGDDAAFAPPRGSVLPGTRHLYNNWDFNAAGAIYEQLAQDDIYDAFAADLAQPLGMEDFARTRQRKTGDLTRSRYPAYHLRLSTRDMARLGLLMLRQGRWREEAILPAGWAARITQLVTPYRELIPERRRKLGSGQHWGYGSMWWVWDDSTHGATSDNPMAGAYTARGLGGQFITVVPALDMVVAHKVDPRLGGDTSQPRRRISSEQYALVLRLLTGARCDPQPCR